MPAPTPHQLLKEIFGYDSFRPMQEQIITNVLAGKDTLAILPTGAGKSLTYQLPALLMDGLTVVVSPLIALMKDQVDQLNLNGVPAVMLNSSLGADAYHENRESLRLGQAKILYASPEGLLDGRAQSALARLPVSCITIDEAHCISEWGHDFRPEYRRLAELRQRYPQATCLALTATATPRVRQDIARVLGIAAANVMVASFRRPNLRITVQQRSANGTQAVLALLRQHRGQAGIIYCLSRKTVETLADDLRDAGIEALPYHAGLDEATRAANQEAFQNDNAQVMVATIAFGMGINKSNVRFVAHYNLPKSVENYYQEIGRAGRDGLPADCVLLYDPNDVRKFEFILREKPAAEQRQSRQQIAQMAAYAENGSACRQRQLLAYFGEPAAEPCGSCDVCRHGPTAQTDITLAAQKYLSCAHRAEGKFAAAHLIKVLLGDADEHVLRWKHDQLSTFGIGKEYSTAQWRQVARQMVLLGLAREEGKWSNVQVTELGLRTLKERLPVLGKAPEATPTRRKRMEYGNGANPPAQGSGIFGRAASEPAANAAPSRLQVAPSAEAAQYDRDLFEALRAKRRELADGRGVPAFLIFSDASLIQMARDLPQSPATFLRINGVGQAKAEAFGAEFLAVIRAYCQANDGATDKLARRG